LVLVYKEAKAAPHDADRTACLTAWQGNIWMVG
jgi:hypothetical protein